MCIRDSFYDMYIFCKSNTETISKGGEKDLSNLNKVKRKVIRNGKEVEMTIYEDSNSDNKDMDNTKKESDSVSYSALGSESSDIGDLETKVNPQVLATTLGKFKSQGIDTSPINESGQMFKDFSNGESVLGLAEFSFNNDTIRLESYISTEESTGVGIRSVIELIKLGIKNNKSIEVYDIQLKEAIELSLIHI